MDNLFGKDDSGNDSDFNNLNDSKEKSLNDSKDDSIEIEEHDIKVKNKRFYIFINKE